MFPIEIREYDQSIRFQIGQRIQRKRLEKKFTAVDVAEYLNIQSNQLSRIENGRANCTIEQMYILAQLLECSVDYLMFGKEVKPPYNDEQIAAINYMLSAFGVS